MMDAFSSAQARRELASSWRSELTCFLSYNDAMLERNPEKDE
jgi:hypothetical protein